MTLRHNASFPPPQRRTRRRGWTKETPIFFSRTGHGKLTSSATCARVPGVKEGCMVRLIAIVGCAALSVSCGGNVFPAMGQSYFVFDDLGALPGHDQARTADINDARQVTGMSWSASESRAFLWTPPGP